MPAIGDSSPLILYAKIGALTLLHDVFTEVEIPPAVHGEVVETGAGKPGAAEVAAASWIRVRALADPDAAQPLLVDLGAGEAEVIRLAVELGRHIPVLLDDRRAREIARANHLLVLGSAGVLVLAKRRGLVDRVGPIISRLLSAGLYLSEAAVGELLRSAGE